VLDLKLGLRAVEAVDALRLAVALAVDEERPSRPGFRLRRRFRERKTVVRLTEPVELDVRFLLGAQCVLLARTLALTPSEREERYE
jgi:hypothetical protein